MQVPPSDNGVVLALLAQFVTQVKVNGFASFIIQRMKDSQAPAFKWISTNAPWATRSVGFLAATATAIGIHYTYHSGTLIITGITLTAIITGCWNIFQNFVFQHAWHKVAFKDPDALAYSLNQGKDTAVAVVSVPEASQTPSGVTKTF